MGMDELSVVMDFAREVGIVLAGGLENHLLSMSTLRFIPLNAGDAMPTFAPFVKLCLAR